MNNRKHYRRPPKAIIFLLIAGAVVLGGGLLVMLLWNAILPVVTSAQPLSYWQGVGLLMLSRLLFGGFRFASPGSHRHSHFRHWRTKWRSMSEEERARFREEWRARCQKPEK